LRWVSGLRMFACLFLGCACLLACFWAAHVCLPVSGLRIKASKHAQPKRAEALNFSD